MARLEIRKLKPVSRVEIAQKSITIGRSSRNDVVLRDERVSREHCIIEVAEGSARARDLGSRTGTFVNNIRISEAILRHHDRISVGPFVLVFRDTEGVFGAISDERSHLIETSSIDNNVQELAGKADAQQIEAAQQLLQQQTAQIAELTANTAMLHVQLLEKSEHAAALQREMESLVQRQRNTEATRQTALDRLDRTQRKIADLSAHLQMLGQAACRLEAVQSQLAAAEREWAEADERADRDGASADLLNRRSQSSAALDRLNRQRDAMIDQLRTVIADVCRPMDQTPHQLASDHETEAKPKGSTRQWWRFGAGRHA